MLRHVRCGSTLRAKVIVISGLLALVGAVTSAALWWVHDLTAPTPGFNAAIALGMTSSIVFAQALVTPGHARVYGVGFIDGRAAEREMQDEQPRRHLQSV